MAKISENIAGLRLRPAFLANNIPVAFATDDFYVPVLGILLKSICETKSVNKGYDLIVLHDGLAPQRISSLLAVTQGHSGVSLRFIDVGRYVHEENLFFTANRPDLSKEAFFRLLVPDLFIHYEKMLYLDCDMIAVQDIAAIFDVDIGDCCVAAIHDFFDPKMLDQGRLEGEVGSPRIMQAYQTYSYFNSGLVLFNLKQIHREFSPGILWEATLEKPWRLHDQDVLNHVFFGRVHFLHPRWNYCDVILLSSAFALLPKELQNEIIEAQNSVGIVHYLFPYRKPWQYVTHYSIAYFWPVAVRSHFYDELLRRQLKFAEDIVVVKSTKGANDKMCDHIQTCADPSDINKLTAYEISLSQQRLILQSMLQNKELEYRLRGKKEGYSRRRLALLAQTDGNIDKIRRVTPKRILTFEFSVCGHCNLRCKGCAHFAPLVREDFADFAESDGAFERLGQLFGGEAKSIHLLGGEPLLHPRITDFMQSIRKHFPIGKIELVTNGLLLPGMDDAFWKTCRENKIQISVTKYPVAFDYVMVQALAAYYGVDFAYYGNSDLFGVSFNKVSLDIAGTQNPDDSFLNCHVANLCITLKNGRIYPCSFAPNMSYFAQSFGGLELSADDSLDIFTVNDKDEILDFVSLPNTLCRYCASRNRVPFDEWGISRGAIEEWIL